MENYKYLLYIDILGFSEMVRNDKNKVEALFTVIDDLNCHHHHDFKTLVFSDTILIFNDTAPISEHDHEYFVMFACEFIQDLMFRTIDLDIQFRAILTYDEFHFHKLKNVEIYYGEALINCYYKEKEINAMGLFIDKRISKHNKIFKTAAFDKDLHFVYLLQSIEFLHTFGEFSLPIDSTYISSGYDFFGLPDDIKILNNLNINTSGQIDSKIRQKYSETYHQYKKRYKWLIDLLELNDFDHSIISPQADWAHLKRG